MRQININEFEFIMCLHACVNVLATYIYIYTICLFYGNVIRGRKIRGDLGDPGDTGDPEYYGVSAAAGHGRQSAYMYMHAYAHIHVGAPE